MTGRVMRPSYTPRTLTLEVYPDGWIVVSTVPYYEEAYCGMDMEEANRIIRIYYQDLLGEEKVPR